MSNQEASPAVNLDDGFPVSASREAMVAVLRAYGTLQRLMEPYFAGFDLTPPQFQVLCIAHRFGDEPPTQRQLACALYVSFPNVTELLKRLERKGLIVRNGNPADRRQKFVRMTRAGRQLLQRIWLVHQKQMDLVMKGLTRAERKEMARLLNKMTAVHR
jgi:DNA-binding MarR family transcriptional regulator